MKRVINTRALILQAGFTDALYIHVYDGWLTSNGIGGPWTQAFLGPMMLKEANDVAQELATKGLVDLLDGGAKANPKPSLANGVPTIYTSQTPTELIEFKGQPNFVPIVGTQLLWASNTTSDVLINTANNDYYALLAGRWFKTGNLSGPWSFVASDALPPDFAKIPPQSLAGAVLPTVAGTPQAQEAVIENSIPQTATVPLKNGPKFTPNFNGPPKLVSIPGTTLSEVQNSSEPIIQVAPNSYYAVVAGVWFTASQLTGPWVIATSVPPAIYSIPPSSPIYYVTYVRIYEATPQYVYVGYTPGYLGVVVSPYGTVVYGTGYVYSPWIGTEWYPPPYTYGVAAAPVYNPYVGFTYGFALGLATAAWTQPYWGGAYYYPSYWGGYPLLRDGQRQRLWALGCRHVFGNALVVRRRRRRRHDGERQLLQQPHGVVGELQRIQAIQRLDRQRHARLRPDDQRRRGRNRQRRAREQLQHLYRPALDRERRVRRRARVAVRTTARVRRRPARKATRTSAEARRTTRKRATPTRGVPRVWVTITMPMSTATSTRTPATAGSSIRRADGTAPAATLPGRIASHRREARATIARAASAKRARCRAPTADSAAAIASAAEVSAALAAAIASGAAASEASAGADGLVAVDLGVADSAAAAGAERDSTH